MDNLIGKRLDGLYEVQELIGSGGMANVYKAVMRGQNGPVPAGTVVAVKVLRREYMHDPDLVRRFKNESKAISLLNHPNIVKVYDVSVNDHLQYIVMEYVDGMTLREYLNERGGKLSSRETVHFISQILKALEHAHANGVVHRDIKPQNIMLLDNGQLRMMDFGIARISRADNQMLAGKAMGSVHYISPEQAKGDETDRTSDIYSVGVMMYEMLSGHLPFDADDVVEVAIKQISDEARCTNWHRKCPMRWWRSPKRPWQSSLRTATLRHGRCWKHWTPMCRTPPCCLNISILQKKRPKRW